MTAVQTMEPRRAVNPHHQPWTPEEDSLLRQHYGTVSWEKLGQTLPGRTKPALNGRAGQLGLRQPKEPPWSEAEIQVLRDLFSHVPLAAIAQKLGRTETGAELKAKRLGLRRRSRRELTANQVGLILQICPKTVKWWIRRRWLPARPAPTQEKQIHLVTVEDLIAFLRSYPDRWDLRRCPDLHVKLGLTRKRGEAALNDRPLWLKEKLMVDNRRKRRCKRWTRDEDIHLAGLVRRGLPYREIGRQMGRSEEAIDHRIHRLGRRLWDLARLKGA